MSTPRSAPPYWFGDAPVPENAWATDAAHGEGFAQAVAWLLDRPAAGRPMP